jgi:GMP synthase (glutamine-hydrolysing)
MQAFRLRDAAWGVQFHPEVTEEELDVWFDLARRSLQPEWGRSADELRDEARRLLPAQQDRARDLFSRFAAVVRSVA